MGFVLDVEVLTHISQVESELRFSSPGGLKNELALTCCVEAASTNNWERSVSLKKSGVDPILGCQ